MLYIIYSIIWFSSVVLQQSATSLPTQETQKDAEESYYMNYEYFSHVFYS